MGLLDWLKSIKIRDNKSKFSSINIEKGKDFLINSDGPCLNHKEDAFNRVNYANRIAQLIITRKDTSSLVIGIFGEWGSGKTSLMNFIKKDLEQDQMFIVIDFNPWNFGEDTQFILNFFQTLSDSIQSKLYTTKENIGQLIAQYSAIVAPLSVTMGVGSGALTADGGLRALGVALSSVKLEDLKTRLGEILIKENKKVVIFIDDVDRLDKDEILSIFKLVKITASFQNIIYIVAFDDKNVIKSLGKSEIEGKLFLEKIIQLPLNLPRISNEDLFRFCLKDIEDSLKTAEISLSEQEALTFFKYFSEGFQKRLKTPRMSKRYCNALKFSLPLVKDELNYVDFMLIEGIRIFYPNLYCSIRSYPDSFVLPDFSLKMHSFSPSSVEAKKIQTKNVIKKSLEIDEEDEGYYILSVLQFLFPRLDTVYGNTHYSTDWDTTWELNKRICSDQYFPRYFLYSIPQDDISDVKFKDFISKAESQPLEFSINYIHDAIRDQETPSFIHKIAMNYSTFSPILAGKMAIAISNNGTKYPKDGSFLGYGTFDSAATLIGRLLDRIEDSEEYDKILKEVIKNSRPLDFTATIIHDLDIGIENKEQSRLSKLQEGEILSIFSKNAREYSKRENIYIKHPNWAFKIFYFWAKGSSKEEISLYITTTFLEDPKNVFNFLLVFSSKGWDLKTGLPYSPNFSEKSYSNLSEIIDPEIVFSAVKQIVGDKELEFDEDDENTPLENRLLFQFVKIHSKNLDGEHAK